MAAELAINLFNTVFPSWPAPLDSLFVLAMSPAEVTAAHSRWSSPGRACSPAERRTAQRIDIAPGVFDCIDTVVVHVS